MSNYLILSNDPATNHLGDACRGHFVGAATSRWGALTGILKTWTARSQQRRQLAQLPLHLLEDMGISTIDAAREAAKPFWKA